jgi:hypothetical protein
MVVSKARTVTEYLDSLSPEQRAAIQGLRKVIKKNLPRGYEEAMAFGMIGYQVPLSRYPDTYNQQPLGVAAIAAHKRYLSLYLMSIYGSPEHRAWFEGAWKKTGKKLDLGGSCVRFKSLDDVPLDVVGEAIGRVPVDRCIEMYERWRAGAKRRPKSK